jgi:hypothetical protein
MDTGLLVMQLAVLLRSLNYEELGHMIMSESIVLVTVKSMHFWL